jgi:hypothetical protein
MYGNGAMIGMENIIITTRHKIIRKDRRVELTACCVAVLGTMARVTFVVQIVAAAILLIVATVSGFDVRGLVNLYTMFYYTLFFLLLFLL